MFLMLKISGFFLLATKKNKKIKIPTPHTGLLRVRYTGLFPEAYSTKQTLCVACITALMLETKQCRFLKTEKFRPL